jgi:hypothetical protein
MGQRGKDRSNGPGHHDHDRILATRPVVDICQSTSAEQLPRVQIRSVSPGAGRTHESRKGREVGAGEKCGLGREGFRRRSRAGRCGLRACYDEAVRAERRRRPTPAATYGGENASLMVRHQLRRGLADARQAVIYLFSGSKRDAAALRVCWVGIRVDIYEVIQDSISLLCKPLLVSLISRGHTPFLAMPPTTTRLTGGASTRVPPIT